MQVSENIPLAPYTTFFIGGPSRYLIFAQDNEEVIEAINFAQEKNLPYQIMGGGSNMLVSDKGYDGVMIRVESVGMDLIAESTDTVTLKIASGEVWDDVVRFASDENWWGIENLSHIPGFTGAFCVQNVGAYGQEASQVVTEVEVYDTQDKATKILTHSQIGFGYRRSIFNSTQKGRYVILSTTMVLSKIPQPNLQYGDLATKFAQYVVNGEAPNIQDIRDEVIKIRDTKFPFPSKPDKGNSGSFFRGPILTQDEFNNFQQKLTQNFPTEVTQKLSAMENKLKVPQGYKTPAAFLIELCGLKDFTIGGAKVNPDQPAIVLNHTGTATSTDVLSLYKKVSDDVYSKTGVKLNIEPELIGFSPEQLTSFNISTSVMV